MIDFTTVQVLPLNATIGRLKSLNDNLLAENIRFKRIAIAALITGVVILAIYIHYNKPQHDEDVDTIE